MRVCMLVDKPLPSSRPTGIGVAAFNMALALSKRRINVHFVCRGAVEEVAVMNSHLTIQTIRSYSRENGRVTLDILRSENPNIVHVHSTAALTSLLFARVFGRTVAMHSHGDEPLHPITLTMMRKTCMSLSHRVIAVSESNRGELIRNQHLPPRKVTVVYNGVDVEEFRPSNEPSPVLPKYGLQDADKILLSIGAVQKRKGQLTVVRCLPKILQKWSSLVYVNVGSAYDSSYQSRLLEEAERLGVSGRVRLLTAVPHDDLVAIINSADLCVHPSTREGFGLAVVEEMACGRAVVAMNIDAMPEIIDHQVDGLLVQPNDQDGLTASILNLLSDVRLSRELGNAARNKVLAKFTWDQNASRLETIYAELLS